MDVFKLIVFPFLKYIELVYQASYSLTSSHGTSIILLSFVVSLTLLPLFIFIEKAKKKDDAIKLKMKPLADEIKRVYKGQERYYYLKTLNRQHNYGQFRALIPVLTLLVQIPFFIAAYIYLENLEALQGVSFWFIPDLSKPDGLLGPVNILPIAMTVVNLVTAWFYTRFGDKSERRQMVVIAGIFLVLLFNLPAGLVLYWTMNNVFSFFRLFVTNREVFTKNSQRQLQNKLIKQLFSKRIRNSYKKLIFSFWVVFLATLGILMFTTSDSTILYNFFLSFAVAIATGSTLTLLIALSPQIILENTEQSIRFYNRSWQVYKSLFFVFLIINISFHLNWAIYHDFNTIILRIIMSIAISYVLVLLLAVVAIIYQGHYKYLTKSIVYTLSKVTSFIKEKQQNYYPVIIYFFAFIVLYFLMAGFFYYSSHNKSLLYIAALFLFVGLIYFLLYRKKDKKSIALTTTNIKQITSIFIISTLFITSIIFFWNPLMVYASFPEIFPLPAIEIFKENALLFVGSIIVIYACYNFLPNRLKSLTTVVFATIFVLFFINIFVVPINVGTLQLGQYVESHRMAKPIYLYLIEALSIFILFIALLYFLKSKYIGYIRSIFLIILLIVIINSLFTSINSGDFLTKANQNIDRPSSISFSKTKENVVFFIPDMFMGYHIHKILEEDEHFFNEYEGFTWYPNTLSISTSTSPSISSILLGDEFNIDKLNKDENRSMREKITEATTLFVSKAKENNYRFSGTNMVYSKIDKNTFDAYLPGWHENWNTHNEQLKIGPPVELSFEILWKNALFYGAPLFLKPRIYNNGNWVEIDNDVKWNTNLTRDCNFIRLLPYISDTLSTEKNLIYIHSKATHRPWNLVSNQGELMKGISPYENQKWFINEFKKWLIWMKENGIYDNTKIVLVSDHSFYMSESKAKKFGKEFMWDSIAQKKLPAKEFWRVNALLMVKDFNKKHPLKKDWRLMSNNDATSIAFNIKGNPTIGKPPSTRTVPVFFVANLNWSYTQKVLPIYDQFNVTDSIYDSKNWKRKE